MSGKPVCEKLMLKPGQTFLLLRPPAGYEKSLDALPKGVKLVSAASGKADAVQVFVRSKNELQGTLTRLKGIIGPTGMIWVTYPKGTSAVKTDINRDSIRTYAATLGLETVAIFSVNSDWSALRLKVA
ncbi:MAG: DUF3052 family protein [Thaumarchaeota archaeon]|nr:DUF3052 family protein [Nitrososphaerota archaeon]